MEENKFKIGDRVKIIGPTGGWNRTGDIGIIHKFATFGVSLFAQVNTNQGHNLESCHTRITSLTLEPLKEYKLPENWCIIANSDTERIVISKWCNDNKIGNEPEYKTISQVRMIHSKEVGSIFKRTNNTRKSTVGFTEISFKIFEDFVVNTKKIEELQPLPFFKILETYNKENDILYVQNNEGNIFRLGDIVIGITDTSKKWGPMKITSFRKTNDGLNVCAITSKTSSYGIGIDKLQHVIEKKIVKPIIQETLLEKAVRMYPKGTKYKTASNQDRHTIEIATGNASYYNNTNNCIMSKSGDGLLYCRGVWAEIIKD